MKKILYYLPNIILGMYLVLIIPIVRFLGAITMASLITNTCKWSITWSVLAISLILKILFRSNKFKLKKIEKNIGTILLVIEIVLILFMSLITNVFSE